MPAPFDMPPNAAVECGLKSPRLCAPLAARAVSSNLMNPDSPTDLDPYQPPRPDG